MQRLFDMLSAFVFPNAQAYRKVIADLKAFLLFLFCGHGIYNSHNNIRNIRLAVFGK